MKKVIALSVVMLLACAVMASADATDWSIYIQSSLAGVDSLAGASIGTLTGATDGYDAAGFFDGSVLEQGDLPPLVGKNVVVKPNAEGWVNDYRSPYAAGTKTWELAVYSAGGYTGVINLDVALDNIIGYSGTNDLGMDLNLPANFDLSFSWVGGSQSYAAGTAPATFTLTGLANGTAGSPTILTVTAGPVIPEPGSMLALGSGIIGLVGFAIRRRS